MASADMFLNYAVRDDDSSTTSSIGKHTTPAVSCCLIKWTHRRKLCTSGLLLLALALILGLAIGLRSSPSNHPALPAYPLAVKSPYLSVWVRGDQAADAAHAQPMFWNGTALTWPILARVNGTVYSLFGNKDFRLAKAAKTTAVTYTASHTYIAMTAGPARFILDFYTPVLPRKSDYAGQSLPYSYLTVSASCNRKASVDVQTLSAIDYTWTAQQGESGLNFTKARDVGFFWFHNPEAVPFSEHNQMASYGSVIFGTSLNSATTYSCDSPDNVYDAFAAQGSLRYLNKTCSSTYLAALSQNLGMCDNIARNATFVVGLDREQAVNYLNTTMYTGYYRTRWPSIPKAVQFVVGQHANVLKKSTVFDEEIHSKAASISNDWGSKYAAITDASVRQSFASLELTVRLRSYVKSETPAKIYQVPLESIESNASISPPLFMKEISTNGNVNTVDYQFHAWPIFACLNPEYIVLLLKPVLNYLSSGQWPHPWAIHDL
jgi:hypothetical protein